MGGVGLGDGGIVELKRDPILVWILFMCLNVLGSWCMKCEVLSCLEILLSQVFVRKGTAVFSSLV